MNNFCLSCGGALVPGAGFCAGCGTKVGQVAGSPQVAASPVSYSSAPKSKSKTTAVLLAVFLGYWSWLYTFKRDKLKFFLGLSIGFVSWVIGLVAYILSYQIQQKLISCYTSAIMWEVDIDTCTSSYRYSYTITYVTGAIGLGIWLWAVIDASRKQKSYFESYPN